MDSHGRPLRHTNRLFVAADLPADARDALARLGAAVQAGAGGCAVPAGNLHVTLDFMGRIPPERLGDVVVAARDALRGPPIPVALGPLRARPGPARARLVAVELADPEGALAARAARLRRALDGALGREPAAAPLWPHVTVLRLGRPARVALPPPGAAEHLFDISRAALYDSHQSPGGPPQYRELAAVEFAPVA